MAVIKEPSAFTTVVGTTGDDQIFSILDPFVTGYGGNQTLMGGLGNDTYIVGNTAGGVVGDTVFEILGEGVDVVVLFTNVTGAYTLANNVEALVSRRFADSGAVASQANSLTGNTLNNNIRVEDGLVIATPSQETLDGGIGADTLAGGLGNDTYIVDNVGDVITEAASGLVNGVLLNGLVNGWVQPHFLDSVQSSITWTLGAALENLTLTGLLNINGIGNALPNVLTGNAGHNLLDGGDGNDNLVGGGGNDTMKGGGGNDTLDGSSGPTNLDGGAGDDLYKIDAATDVLAGDAGGIDTVNFVSGATFNSFTLPAFIENAFNIAGAQLGSAQAVAFTGNALDNNLYGGSGADTLIGGDGNDILDGVTGNDSMAGGKGNDVYVLDSTTDLLAAEKAAEGIDTVYVTIAGTQTFSLGTNFERLFLLGGGNAGGTGNALDNAIVGNTGNNTLLGGLGNDNMDGQAGNDTISGGTGNDTIEGFDGNDSVSAGIGVDLVRGGAGEDSLDGGPAGDTMDGADTLDGGAGNDSMGGGAGNDFYFVDSFVPGNPTLRDIVFEQVNNGIDTVSSSASINLLYANVENLILTGLADLNGTGNTLMNAITGNIGANILDAGRDAVADSLIGGGGNDTYIIYGTNDIVTDVVNVPALGAPGPGFADTVIYRGALAYSLAANVETLVFDSGLGNVNGAGNILDNMITGSAGANSIDGGGGNDTVLGGNGADTVLGGAGNDSLNGQGGIDVMAGGGGDDTYVLEDVDDIVDELIGGGGNDTVLSFVRDVDIRITNANMKGLIEHITLGGGALNAIGNDLGNTIRGNALRNRLEGGIGNDTYFADLSDMIVEGSATMGGVDHVHMDVGTGPGTLRVRNGTAPSYTQPGDLWNVEHVTLVGTGSYNVLFDHLAATATQVNAIVGNDGNNILDAAGGADSMTGGKGNDTYYVDNIGDKTIELLDQGTDTVFSTVAWSLAAEVENLNLIGPGIATGAGNLLNNFIRGNGAANALTGLAGNDTLDGGGGNDALNGADGDDTYFVDSVLDVVTDSTGTDTVVSTVAGATPVTLGAGIENLVFFNGWAIPPLTMAGAGNLLDNRITGNFGSANIVDGKEGSDTFDFNIIGSLGSSDSIVGGLNADTMSTDTLLVDLTGAALSLGTRVNEVEVAVLRAEGATDGTIDFGSTAWADLRAVTVTGSAAPRVISVFSAPHTGFVNDAVSGTKLVFGFEDFNGAELEITANNAANSTTDAINVAIRDSGLNATLTLLDPWEVIRIDNRPSPDGSFAANTLDLTGLTASANRTVIEVTGAGGGQLNLTNLAYAELSGGPAFTRDLRVQVTDFDDRLQIRGTNTGTTGDVVQVDVRNSSFWLDLGQSGGGDRDFETMEINALGGLNTSFVHLNEASTVMNGTLSVAGASGTELTIDGITAATINASGFLGTTLNLTAESNTAGTWTGPTTAAVNFRFTGGGGGDTFDFDGAAGLIDGMDLVDGGAGTDTVEVDVTGMGVSGTSMSGGLHLANVENVNMNLTSGSAVVDAAAIQSGAQFTLQSSTFTSLTVHGFDGNFDVAGGVTGDLTLYSRSMVGRTYNAFNAGTTTIFGSQAQGVGDTFNFGIGLDNNDYVQAFDFDPANPDTLTASLDPISYMPQILGVENVTFTIPRVSGTTTIDAQNMVGVVNLTLTDGAGGTSNAVVLNNLNWAPGTGGQLVVNAAGLGGATTLNGSEGNDSITGGGGLNTINADEGADTLVGGGVADTLSGEGGNDVLNGAGGADRLLGGDGNDTFNLTSADGAADTVDGGAGSVDALDYSSFGVAVTVTLSGAANGSATGTGLGTETLISIERVIGSTVADTLNGTNTLALTGTAADGAQTFQGRGGNDIINGGGTQNGYLDLVDYNTGNNPVVVNLSSDAFTITALAQGVLAGDAEDLGGGGTIGTDDLSNIDGAFGSSGADLLIGGSSSTSFSGSLFEVWRGNGGNDTITGSLDALPTGLITGFGISTVDTADFDMADYANDPNGVVVDLRLGTALDGFGGTDLLFDITHVRGSAFDDYLTGGNAGNNALEVLDGGAGDDHLDGGSGFDMARYTGATSGVNASLLTGLVQDGQGGTDTLFNIEGLQGGDFADTLTGGAGNDVFQGMKGNDLITGGAGNDLADYQFDIDAVQVDLSAGTATDGWNDTDTLAGIENVRGSQFADTIVGDGNANRLDGGGFVAGIDADTLTGGGGADTFVFATTLSGYADTITDFVTAVDKFELDDAVFGVLALGTLAPGAFALGFGAVGASTRIIYDGGTLYYDPDGSGGTLSTQFASLSGTPTVVAGDFVIV